MKAISSPGVCSPCQQPKYLIMFYKNSSPHDLYTMTLCVSGDETLASGAAEITRIFAGICLSVYLSVFLSACLTQLVYVFRVTSVIVIWHRQHKNLYHKVANRGTSCLVATQRIYWMLMKGKFNASLLWTFGKTLIFEIVARSTVCNSTVTLLVQVFRWQKN